VRLIGATVEVTEHSTNTVFRIEDGTGKIDAKVFNDNDETVGSGMRLQSALLASHSCSCQRIFGQPLLGVLLQASMVH
jgi:hypothetical protein